MLARSDTPVASALARFNARDLDVGVLVPTETGMAKSIMDATQQVRAYLATAGCHDFDEQQQGQEHKRVVKAFFVRGEDLEETTASLYRPQTKSGDPRIWFAGLGSYARPWNLLAITLLEGAIFVVNCSDARAMGALDDPASALRRVIGNRGREADDASDELLRMMRGVSAEGYIRTLRPGPTGVGMTLETRLGISANTNQATDYKGIEIKASRVRPRGTANRVTLFSQVPSWKVSPVGSAWALLQARGYPREEDGRMQLYHQLDAVKPNSRGLILALDAGRGWLRQDFVGAEYREHDATWLLEKLRGRLREKHPSTFWVKANVRGAGDDEAFHYVEIIHTRNPKVSLLEPLIEAGTITLDYTLSDKGGRARDHGYLFKIHPDNVEALFPPPVVHQLT